MQCCFLAFWLCSFACGRAFLDDEMSLCLCLWLANTKTWFSPSPTVFFFLVLIFFYYNWIVFWSCFFTVVFLAPLARPFSGAVCSFRLLLLAPLYPKCNPLSLCFFAALLLSFLLSCWTCWSCCLFFLATLRSNTCPTMPPVSCRAPFCPLFSSFCSKTLIRTLSTHMRPLKPSSRARTWLCLWWCLFVFLRGCWPHCVCPCDCDCACWWVCTCFLCLFRCFWLNYMLAYVFVCVVRVCVCVCVCLYFGQSTCISITCTDHACLN